MYLKLLTEMWAILFGPECVKPSSAPSKNNQYLMNAELQQWLQS